MKLPAATALSLSLLASAFAQTNQTDSQAIQIIRRGSQPSQQGPAENFTGSVRVEPLFQANAPARASGSLSRSSPAPEPRGTRTRWVRF